MKVPSPTVAAFVPMRHSSARVEGKNYRTLGGRPLYHHIVATLLEVPQVHQVVIDTDSPLIMEDAAEAFPDRVSTLPRAEHLLGELASISEILIYDIANTPPADLYIHTHSTNPLLRASTIGTAISTFWAARNQHDSLFGVTPRQVRFYWPDGRPINHDPDNLLRTQDLPPVYEENSCLYLFTQESIERRRNRLGEHPLMFEIEGDETADIDDEHDWALVEALHEMRMRTASAAER